MSFDTYEDFKDSLARWLDDDSDGLDALIDDLITVGETRIFREVRTRDMEEPLSSTISAGVIALPADYVALKFAYIDGTPTKALERRPAEWIYAQYPSRSASGKPKFIAREGSNFIFGPYADSAYTVKGVYYKRLSSISTSLNALFTASPDLYLFGCLAESEIAIGRDRRLPMWEAKYKNILDRVNGEDRAEDQSGSTLQMRA